MDAQVSGELDEITSQIENSSEPGDVNVTDGGTNDGGSTDDGGGANGGNGGNGGPRKTGGGGDDGSSNGSGSGNNLPATTEESVAQKLDKYLLNPDHPAGQSKANWFRLALGFTRENAADLAKQIVFDQSSAVETGVTQYGTKFNQIIRIVGANGKVIDVLFAWIKNNDGIVRLVTAIPPK